MSRRCALSSRRPVGRAWIIIKLSITSITSLFLCHYLRLEPTGMENRCRYFHHLALPSFALGEAATGLGSSSAGTPLRRSLQKRGRRVWLLCPPDKVHVLQLGPYPSPLELASARRIPNRCDTHHGSTIRSHNPLPRPLVPLHWLLQRAGL